MKDNSHGSDQTGANPMTVHTKPPFRVGKNGLSVVADDDTGLTQNGSTGPDAVKYYGGNLIAESCTPGNAQFLVDACNFYWRALNMPVNDPRVNELHDAAVEIVLSSVSESVVTPGEMRLPNHLERLKNAVLALRPPQQ